VKRLLFDTEGNGLLPTLTKFHCICACDVDTREAFEWGPKEIPSALETLDKADVLIAHHGIGYDYQALNKLHGFKKPDGACLDTLVIARTIYPNIKELDSKFNKTLLSKGLPTMGDQFGKHTVEAWGLRLGVPKLHADITDWSTWTPQMQERCAGDVQTQLKLWDYLKPDTYSQAALELEHRVARLCQLITQAGWPFNEKEATDLYVQLVEEKEELERKLKEHFTGWVDVKTESFTPKRDNKSKGWKAGVTIQREKQKVIEFNPRSRPQIERALRDLGWIPTEKTESGRAKLDEEQIEQIAAEFPQAEGLARYLMLDKRIGQIATGKSAWLKTVGEDGKIHAEYNPMGAVTSRASHYNPNIAQVPAVSSPFGNECRALFYVPEGWDEVGADMSGLEGRCFSHYLCKYDGGAYGRASLEGDPHWAVVLAVGYLDCERDKHNRLHTMIREQGAKRLFYGMLYGSGDEKAGRIILDCCRMVVKEFPEEGERLFELFFDGNQAPGQKALRKAGKQAKENVIAGIEGFADLKRVIDHYAAKGYLPGLDKRRIPVRSEHAALNSLLQSAGAILCKRWICDAYDMLIAEGLKYGWDGDFVFLGWIHDELQVACRNGLGDRIGRVLTSAAQEAGKTYGFRIRLDSEYKIGKSWQDTH
jgi:hypothetical protein